LLLKTVLEDYAPQPFKILEDEIIGYSEYSEEETKDALYVRTPGDLSGVIEHRGAIQAFAGATGNFMVDAVPLKRSKGIEKDVYLWAEEKRGVKPDRLEIYKEWFLEQCVKAGIVAGIDLRVEYLGLRQIYRCKHDSVRTGTISKIPLVRFTGIYAGEPAEAIRRGIGRHRAFGYGLFLTRGIK